MHTRWGTHTHTHKNTRTYTCTHHLETNKSHVDRYIRTLDTSKLTFVPHYKSTCSSRFMKMDCKSYNQAPVRECMSLSLCVGPPGCSWNMYAVSGSVEPLRIELGGRLLLMAATAAPQPSGSWKVLRYLWKFTAPFCTGHKKSEKINVICKAAELYWHGLASIQMMCFHEDIFPWKWTQVPALPLFLCVFHSHLK